MADITGPDDEKAMALLNEIAPILSKYDDRRVALVLTAVLWTVVKRGGGFNDWQATSFLANLYQKMADGPGGTRTKNS